MVRVHNEKTTCEATGSAEAECRLLFFEARARNERGIWLCQFRTKLSFIKKAFTLIEVIIAVAVIAIGIVAAVDLAVTSNRLGNIVLRKFMAHHLAEEGLEIVRNMRDTNWMKNLEWRRGIADGNYMITTRNTSLAAAIAPAPAQDHPLFALQRVDTRGRGEAIPLAAPDVTFYRFIQIATPDPEQKIMRVTSTVRYEDRGVQQEISLDTELSDWKKGAL